MYCNQCGKQIPDDAKFCHHCGSPVGIVQKNEAPADTPKEKTKNLPKTVNETAVKKPAVPTGKKKTIIIAAAVLLVIVVIIIIIVSAANSQKVLAELPDPEYYFPAIDEVKEHDDKKLVVVRSDEDLWDQAAGYVNLLKWSGKYPLTQSYEERYDSGDYTWHFMYTNKDDIKHPYYNQIEVTYYYPSEYRNTYAIWVTIYDTDAFDLVQRERYTDELTAEPEVNNDVSLPATSTDSGSFDSGSSFTDTGNSDDTDDFDDSDDFEVPDSSDIYDSRTPCGVCNRSGDCKTCSGDGYLMSSASDKEDRNCYSCSGSGNCRSCGGDGWL